MTGFSFNDGLYCSSPTVLLELDMRSGVADSFRNMAAACYILQ